MGTAEKRSGWCTVGDNQSCSAKNELQFIFPFKRERTRYSGGLAGSTVRKSGRERGEVKYWRSGENVTEKWKTAGFTEEAGGREILPTLKICCSFLMETTHHQDGGVRESLAVDVPSR